MLINAQITPVNFNNQLLFFFSALGVFNGILLSGFLWRAGPPQENTTAKFANWFLSLMLLMICIRIGKSVFFFFSPDLSLFYLQVGLSACFMIGPFLYFYLCAAFDDINLTFTKIQIAGLLSLVLGVGLLYPYETNPELWRNLIFRTVNLTWFVYLILAWQRAYSQYKAENITTKKLQVFLTKYSLELSVLTGNSLIWLAYYTSRYTSYIAGALSFSFITYLTLIVWFRQRNQAKQALQEKNEAQKYADKLDEDIANQLNDRLKQLMEQDRLFTDANLTLPTVAKKLGTNVPVLSQFLNDNLNKPFTQFVNEYRINEAKQLLLENKNQSIEVIAEQCGFNSQSTFYTAFKKHTDTTPARFRQTAPDSEKDQQNSVFSS